MGYIDLIRCVLELRCGMAVVVWLPPPCTVCLFQRVGEYDSCRGKFRRFQISVHSCSAKEHSEEHNAFWQATIHSSIQEIVFL